MSRPSRAPGTDASREDGEDFGTERIARDQPFTVAPGRRQIRSFVLRQGRFTPAQ